jgi:ribosomal protein S6--L-glutamate ligase
VKIAILSRSRSIFSTARLVEAGQLRGHQMSVFNTLRCTVNIRSTDPEVWYEGQELWGFDAVIPRIGASITGYGQAVIRQFEMAGVYSLTESNALARSRDKLRSLQLLSQTGVGLPRTSFAHSVRDSNALIQMVGGAPVVIKLLSGTQGRGVVLAQTAKAAESVIDAFHELNADFLVQEYIAEAGGSDLRCFVIGNRVVAAMQRTAAKGEFRSNLHRGGSAELVKITRAERATAVKAAKTMGLTVAGVDLLRSSRGPLVMEVNSSPGLEGIEAATGIDVAGKIIEHIEENVGKSRVTTRGRG